MFHSCEISDSFVHPNMKLSNGKNGNGESRLFISNSKEIVKRIVKSKSLYIDFDKNYINDFEEFVAIDTNLHKHVIDRKNNWITTINEINCCHINIYEQNGKKDVNRNYISGKSDPQKRKKDKTENEKENIEMWDKLRLCLIPTDTTFQFFDMNKESLRIYITYNKHIHKYNKPNGCSFVSMEFLNTISIINNIEIQHSMNGGEHKERKPNGYFWPVDGYHNCSLHKCIGTYENLCLWNNYVFEFQGDYWHKDKRDKDLAKKEFYLSKGYKWFEITETEWTNRKKLYKSIINYYT